MSHSNNPQFKNVPLDGQGKWKRYKDAGKLTEKQWKEHHYKYLSILFVVKEYHDEMHNFVCDRASRSLSEGGVVNDQLFQDIFQFESNPEAHSLKCAITGKQINVSINKETKQYQFGDTFPVMAYILFQQLIAEGKLKIQPTENFSTAFHRHIHFANRNSVKEKRNSPKFIINRLLNNVDLPVNMIVYGGDDEHWLALQGYFTAYGIRMYLPSSAFGFSIFKEERDIIVKNYKIPFKLIKTSGKSDRCILAALNQNVKVGAAIDPEKANNPRQTQLDGDGNNLNVFQSSIVVKDICGAYNEQVKKFCYNEKEGWKVADSDLNKTVNWNSTTLSVENKITYDHEKRIMVRLFTCSDSYRSLSQTEGPSRSARVRREILYSLWTRYADDGMLYVANDLSNIEEELGSQIDSIIRTCNLPWKNAHGALALRFDFFKITSRESELQPVSECAADLSKYYLNEIGYWPQQEDMLADLGVHRGPLKQLVSVLGVWIDKFVCNEAPYPV